MLERVESNVFIYSSSMFRFFLFRSDSKGLNGMIRKTVYKYKSRTGELISMDSVCLNTKDAKWWMNKVGAREEVNKENSVVTVKRSRGNITEEVEFVWLNNLEIL